MSIHVSSRDLHNSAILHYGSSSQLQDENQSTSKALLIFYAAECALKSALMRRRSLNDTSQIEENLGKTHDLRKLAKELKIAPNILTNKLGCRSRDSKLDSVDAQRLHEAWRYGRKLNKDDESAAVIIITSLYNWGINDK